MPKVYVKVPGLELRIDRYGTASEKTPIEVPEEVAAELRKHPHLRVELDVDVERVVAEAARPRIGPRRAHDAAAEKKED